MSIIQGDLKFVYLNYFSELNSQWLHCGSVTVILLPRQLEIELRWTGATKNSTLWPGKEVAKSLEQENILHCKKIYL